jgi:hypothetical protein
MNCLLIVVPFLSYVITALNDTSLYPSYSPQVFRVRREK